MDNAMSYHLQEAIDKTLMELSEVAEGYARDQLPHIAEVLVEQLDAVGYEIVRKSAPGLKPVAGKR